MQRSSALHNTALVVNSMTFGQNAAVSPYAETPRRRQRQFFLIRPYSAPSLPPRSVFFIASTRGRAYLSSAFVRNELRR